MSNDMPLGAPNTATPDGPADEPLAAPSAVTDDDAALGIEDATQTVAPEDFDFAAFVEGARPGRRAITLSMRGDLIAEMELLIGRIEDAEKRGDNAAVDALLGEYEQTKGEYLAARRAIIVEARSTEWLQNLQKQAKKQHGLDPKKPGDNLTIMLRQMAGQIVHPTQGVTVEALRRLYETSEVELDKLWRACQSANSTSGVVPGFSRRSSATNRPG